MERKLTFILSLSPLVLFLRPFLSVCLSVCLSAAVSHLPYILFTLSIFFVSSCANQSLLLLLLLSSSSAGQKRKREGEGSLPEKMEQHARR